ncbi:MAG TPA: class I SAM-dependent methyltransferase [Acidimicrobiales bacterium]|jgi:SAM-dependent methyltransferase|nr:class I SAM-dependent methyltransferase [Acidimicrobiales bacterium]
MPLRVGGDVRYDDRRADEYDDRYAGRLAEAEATADFLAAVDRPPGPVLELGVGTGRLALPLAARGLEVHGIDASPAMVARLRAKPGGDRIPVTIGDFADVAGLVPGPYALVYLAFNTLFELDDQEAQIRCIAGVAARLAPGGAFVLEAFPPDLGKAEDAVTLVDVDEAGARLQAVRHDPVAQVVTGQTITVTEAGIGLWPFRLRYATVPELDLMARLAGLHLRSRWGGWRGEPFTAASARHVSVYERSGCSYPPSGG